VNTAVRTWLFAGVASTIGVLVSIRFLDHPIADFLELHFRHTVGWKAISSIVAPVKIMALIALAFLFWVGACRIVERPIARWAETALVFAWAEVWALATEFVFKQIFGRAWPDPTYLRDHLDGFRLLHASDAWTAFPSGHALSTFALAAACWHSTPRWRVPMLIIATSITGAMVACNYHWLSDVIAGGILGWSVGWMTVLVIGLSAPASKYPSVNHPGTGSL
jgi:membrane-associated phospholipid phosphatase